MNEFNSVILKILRKLKMRDFVYSVLNPFITAKIDIDPVKSREYLEKTHPKLISSAITKNHIIENNLDLTIIIPVYNVKNYIEECLSSVLSQKTKYSYKVVLVDDGSTDGTLDVLMKYKNDNRIEIRMQQNSGQSVARNNVLKRINSKYIMFVDSDDKLDTTIVEKLMNKAYEQQCDLVECGYHRFKENKIIKSFSHNNEDDVTNRVHLYGMPWGKVFKSSIFSDIKFPEGYWYEDTIMAFLVFPLSKKIATISDCLYYYRYNQQSSSYVDLQNKKRIDGYWITEQCLADRKTLNILVSQELYDHMLIQIVNNYHRIKDMDIEIKKHIFSLSKQILEENFKNFKTTCMKYRDLEKAIRMGDFRKYSLFCFLKE